MSNSPLHQGQGNAIGNAAASPFNQQMLGQDAQAMPAPTLLERVMHWRKNAQARDKVLEYIEAQLNMDLFKNDPVATQLFKAGMSAAIEVIGK